MKKFIRHILLYFAIMTPIFAVFTVCSYKYLVKQIRTIPTYVTISHEVNVQRSIEKIRKCKENKIILIGGSNIGFGFNSDVISKRFNMPVFNTGTHAAIGLRLQIEIFKEYMCKGDIVVVIPEYAHFFGNFFYGEGPMIRTMAANDISLKKLTTKQILLSIKYIFLELGELEEIADFEGAYSSHSLNEYGDISQYRTHQSIESYKKSNKGIQEEAFLYLKEFINDCESTIILLPPVCQDKTFDNLNNNILLVDSILRKNGIEFQASPYRYRFNDSLMFDTPYHCTSEGAIIRTNMVIEDMQRILGK